MIEIPGKYTIAKIMIDEIDKSTLAQIIEFVNHPAFTNPVSIMPDTHAGAGAVIGFTMELTDKVIPNVIGVDINCGMLTFRIENIFPYPHDPRPYFEKLDAEIRKKIPFGTNVHNNSTYQYKISEFPWREVNEQGRLFTMAFNRKFNTNYDIPMYGKNWFHNKCEQIGMDTRRAIRSLGTLGSGNHFIEMGVSDNNEYWATIHSGSRQFGQKIATHWQNVASSNLIRKNHNGMLEEVERIKKECPQDTWHGEIMEAKKKYNFVPKGLEYLEGKEVFDYLIDMVFAQTYADENRRIMKEILASCVSETLPRAEIQSSHNYIDFKDFIIRKGAISAYAGESMIIPFNMEEGTLICKGKGNAEWNYSAPHGAGRIMSRSDAKKKAKSEGTLQKAKQRMEEKGVFASHLPADELKEAYKDAKIIEDAIAPTAMITHRIRPLIAMKD